MGKSGAGLGQVQGRPGAGPEQVQRTKLLYSLTLLVTPFSLPHSFTYLLCCIHSLTHSLTRWTHSLTYIHSLAHTHFYSDPNAYTCIGNLYMCICMAVTHSLTHSLTQSLTHPFTHSLTHSLTRASHCSSSRTPCGRQHYWSRPCI